MQKRNFLLGKGERLAEDVKIGSAPVDKIAPYTLEEAKDRLEPMLAKVAKAIDNLPEDACPDDLAVAKITLSPEYIAKSYYPGELLRSVGLESIGSKGRSILPEKRSKGRKPEQSFTSELFVLGKRQNFKNWANTISSYSRTTPGADQITTIEEISFPDVDEKIKGIDENASNTLFEVVLHLNEYQGENRFLGKFSEYLEKREIQSLQNKRFYAGGLCFLEIEGKPEDAKYIANYSLVRVVRKMPSLRLLRPVIRTGGVDPSTSIKLPDKEPIDRSIKVAVFDGGIPIDHPIKRWVTPFDVPGIGNSVPELLEHGVGVSSALLFGHIDPKKPLATPYCTIDHYRVLDDIPGQNPYELYEILDRIKDVLNTTEYNFINLSLGPRLPIDDDEVHAWTAVLDDILSNGRILAAIAVGNDGEGDPMINANRVQVPSDCVNALAIGACDVPDHGWGRASYSSIGPGRSPGIIKPDLVEFGGSVPRPFLALDPINGNTVIPTGGTSYSAPSVLRLGVGVRAHFGVSLGTLAIKTLLIHSCEPKDLPKTEIGWGRVARFLDDIVLCDDGVMRVVYQGKISASKYIRTPIPTPLTQMTGMVTIKATLCYATRTDPHHPDNYTRSGLSVTFRPHREKVHTYQEGATSLHAKSKTFFSSQQKEFQTEEELRRDAWKWENCLHASTIMRGSSLFEPVFDIHYNARSEGHNDISNQEINYALVISVEAPKVADLYDQVVRRYSTQLEQLTPVVDIPIRI